jgi:hypothetical protein
MIESKHKVAALVHIAHGGYPGAWPVANLPPELWSHLEERGWVVVARLESRSHLLTSAGVYHLQELLRG